MIYEYALDPDLFFEWAKSDRDAHYYASMFGCGTPRFMSSFPRQKPHKWLRYINSKLPTDIKEVERKRLDSILDAFLERRVIREDGNLTDKAWIDDVLAENSRLSFDCIFSKDSPGIQLDRLFTLKDSYQETCGLWHKKSMLTPARTAEAMADSVGNLLRLSKKVVVVDPFGSSSRAINTYKAFISKMMESRVSVMRPQLNIMFDPSKKNAAHPRFIYDTLLVHCGDIDLRVFGIIERDVGEKLHNRYILTELGGVSFGVGTDEGEAHHTDDLVLMDSDMYRRRWDQYVANPVFDFSEIAP
jgi:hypothetical protein